MDTDSVLGIATRLLQRWTQQTETPEPERLDVTLDAADLVAAVTALQESRWGYLATITGVDLGPEAGEIELLYHFCAGAAVVTLRVRTPRNQAFVPSICDVVPSASFYERELMEMLGVTVANTPNTDRLFLPDDWPQGVYPLRKDFRLDDAPLPRSEP